MADPGTLMTGLYKRALERPSVIVLPDGGDERSAPAARLLIERRLGRVLVLGNLDTLKAVHGDNAHSKLQLIDPALDERLPVLARNLVALRAARGKPLSEEEALVLAAKPLYFAALLVASGEATCSVGGSLSTTADVLRAGLFVLGTAPAVKTVSSFFVAIPRNSTRGEFLFLADCAVVPRPTPEQLADIAIATSLSMRKLFGTEPRVAMLSFCTQNSAEHEEVERIRQALSLASKADTSLLIDGPLQFDAAYVPAVAAKKAPESTVAGRANILIFPDLNAGNIGYKIMERLGNTLMIGPIIQGLARPYLDLSRGCSAEDIANTAVLGCLLGAS